MSTKGLAQRLLAIAFIGLILSAGAYGSGTPHDLTVLCAASLTGAMGEIGESYRNVSGVHVTTNFEGTQILRTQVEEGAFADVFVSANSLHMSALQAEGLMINDTVRAFVRNSLVVIVPKGNLGSIMNLTDLARPGQKIVMGTKEVPVGIYALQLLDNLAADPAFGPQYREQVLDNVVSLETNVNYVVSKIALCEADAGIVYKSDVTPRIAEKVSKVEIPGEHNVMAEYFIGVMSQSEDAGSASDFIGFVMSPQGEVVYLKYVYMPSMHNLVGEGNEG